MQENFYIAINGQQHGPFSKETLREKNISADTLVWRPGLSNWVKASELPELSDIIIIQSVNNTEPPFIYPQEEAEWFAMIDGTTQIGPVTLSELINTGITPSTPVWKNGMPDWVLASDLPEVMDRLNHHRSKPNFSQNPRYGADPGFKQNRNPDFGRHPDYGNPPNYDYGNQPGYGNPDFRQNPQYGPNNPYSQQNPYNPYRQQVPTNWLPWAIVATIAGFLCSCIGAIFGIIGIVQANKANNFYAAGNYNEGDRVNSNARTMTIIGFVLAGVGLLVGLSTGISLFNY